MSVIISIFTINVLAATVAKVTNNYVWCGFNIAMAIFMVFSAMVYEGRLINRIKTLEQEIDNLKRRV